MSQSQLLNLTPHPIHLLNSEGQVLATYPPRPIPARAEEIEAYGGHLYVEGLEDAIHLVKLEFGAVKGLPRVEVGVWLIVSRIVAEACPDHGDLLAPHGMVRDENGVVIGCTQFSIV